MRFSGVYSIVFLADMSNGILLSTLPLYASGLGASLALVSAITSTSGVVRIAAQLYLGDLSDRKGRRLVAMISLSSMTLFAVVVTFISDPLLLVGASVLNGLSIAVFGTVAAYIGDNAQSFDIDRSMSMNMLSQGAGFSIGPILGGLLAQNLGFHYGYYLAAAISAAALVMTSASMRQNRFATNARREKIFKKGKDILKNRRILATCGLAAVMSFAFSSMYTFFPLRAKFVGLSAGQIGVALGVRTLLSTVVRLPAGHLSQRIGRVNLLSIALALPFVSSLLIPLFSTLESLTLAVSLEGIGFGVFLTISRSLVAASSDLSNRGIAMGMLDVFAAIGQTLLILAIGVVADLSGLSLAFIIQSVIILLGGAVPLVALQGSKEKVQGPAGTEP